MLIHVAAGDEFPVVNVARVGVLFDDAPHFRLGEARLVGFVVAVAAVTDEVDEHVRIESLAVFDGQFGHKNAGFGVVAVDVENGRASATLLE